MSTWHDRVFFGLHYDLHATAADTVLGAELTHDHLRESLSKVAPDLVQCDGKGHYGHASWRTKIGTASPGIVNDAVRIHRDVTFELGIPLVVHYSSIWDEAACLQHPDWARVLEDGTSDTRFVCVRSPYQRELMIPQLLELATEYSVDGVWVDGDNWGAAPCWCGRCLEAYGSKATEGPDWLAFHRESFMEWVRGYVDAVSPHTSVCSNWLYTVRQPDEVTIPIDWLSGDFAYAYGHERAAIEGRFMDSRGLPWDLMGWTFLTAEPGATGADPHRGWTMKTLPQLCQEAACVLSVGGALLVYDHPLRTGRLVGWHQDRLAELAEFCRQRKSASFGTESVPQALVVHRPEHYYSSNSPLYNLGSAVKPVEGALFSLLELHVHADVATGEADLSRWPLVVVPEQSALTPEFVQRLEAYVRGGGRLLITGDAIVGELAGIRLLGEVVDQPHSYVPVDGEVTTVRGPWQRTELAGARSIADLYVNQDFDPANTPAATVYELGAGRVVAVPAPFFTHYARTRYPRQRRFIRQLINALDAPLLLEADAPATVQMSLRRRDQATYVHLLNLASDYPLSERNVTIDAVPASGPVTVRLRTPEPKSVRLIPDGELSAEYADGWLAVHIPEVGIHCAIEIAL